MVIYFKKDSSPSMATFPAIADSEMNYFQYKAKQMLLLKKENREWQDFCSQIAPDCAACLAEKSVTESTKDSKEIGIQAFPQKSLIKAESSVPLRSQNISEALTSIKTRLEKIDFTLSKFSDTSQESKKTWRPAIQQRSNIPVATADSTEALKQLEEQHRLLIQNSLKASLQKLSGSKSVTSKKSLSVKPKNSGYFLPHDLQLKRAAARKAYLASLQTKPKIIPRNVSQSGTKCNQTSFKEKNTPKKTPKSRKNIISKQITKESDVNKERISVEAFVPEVEKDAAIENVVDGILEDLLGDTVLDFNKIKQMKMERKYYQNTKKMKETLSPLGSLNSSPMKNTESKVLVNDGSKSIRKLKFFLDSSEKMESEHLRKEEFQDKSTNTSKITDTQGTHCETYGKKSFSSSLPFLNNYEIKVPPKFVCGLSRVITIGLDEAEAISQNKDRFWKYLERTSQTAKGNFNPWILNETLAESILDDCLKDIAEELSQLPSTSVQELYNQEFLQQVEN